MELSARNQLQGIVKSIETGAVMAEVVVDVGGQEMVAAITVNSVERLAIEVGDTVSVIVKSTDVMIGK